MLMADTIAILLVVLGFMLSFPALWLCCRGFWAGAVERSSARCAANPYKCFGAGLFGAIIVALLAAVLGSAGGAGGALAALLVGAYVIWAHVGVAGLATHLGRKLPSPGDDDRPWKATLRGGIALELTYLLPVAGWFVILPLSWIYGAGAANLAWLDRRRERKSSQMVVAPQTPAMLEPVVLTASAIQGAQ